MEFAYKGVKRMSECVPAEAMRHSSKADVAVDLAGMKAMLWTAE